MHSCIAGIIVLFTLDAIPLLTEITSEQFDDTIIIKWIPPDLLEGYTIIDYKIVIDSINYTNQTTSTNITITLDDGILFNRQYEVQIIPRYSYCNEYDNSFFTTIKITGGD